jgi:hypothetical protein
MTEYDNRHLLLSMVSIAWFLHPPASNNVYSWYEIQTSDDDITITWKRC